MIKLSLGFSPCPNDTFMFDGLLNQFTEQSEFSFETHLLDVQELNIKAQEGLYDITKISFSNYPAVSSNYAILNAGCALGKGCGPLLIGKKIIEKEQIKNLSIAIPGKHTTANLLLSLFFPDAINKTEYLFSEIENAILSDKVQAGLIIHENRFTYEAKGLKKIADMGDLWETETGSPIPLGCIIIKRSLGNQLHQQFNNLLKMSIQRAVDNPKQAMNYVKKHASEMDEKVMKQHIDLYVTNFSLNLGAEGKRAIDLLFKKGISNGLLPPIESSIFIQ